MEAASTQQEPVPHSPNPGESSAVVLPPRSAATSEPSATIERDRQRPSAPRRTSFEPEPTPATDELAAEIQQIAAADRALARGELRRALQLAREHAVAHPHGQLAIERTAIELGARRQLGEPGAAAAAATFLREHADVPAATKVRTRCASTK